MRATHVLLTIAALSCRACSNVFGEPQHQFVPSGSSTIKNPGWQGAGGYGLAFVAPANYGYGDSGSYSIPGFSGRFGFQGAYTGDLGPGRYAFPVFDHNQGYGGYGALGYYGHNLGFAYPGFGIGNGIFGEGRYANQFI